MKFIALLLILTTFLHSEESPSIDHIKQSIYNACLHHSKLDPEILQIEGMSSSKVRHLLNNICSLPGARYLEIGTWAGSTFISALYGNDLSYAIAIDNWSEFGGPLNEFKQNCDRYLKTSQFDFYSQDCFQISKDLFKDKINIYFYDGHHSEEAQEQALTYFDDILDDLFILIVDDWNHPPAKSGTIKGLDKLNYRILYSEELPASHNGDLQNWWNGIFIGLVKKPGSSYQQQLQKMYEKHTTEWSDIYEHLPTLRDLAKECPMVAEIGVRSMNSTWGVLLGLSENPSPFRSYLGIDLNLPPVEIFHKAKNLAVRNHIAFDFRVANDMDIDIEPVDLLFIDSLHTYAHLTYELEKFSPKTKRYIALHDTDAPWGNVDDHEYHGDFSEYPPHIDRTKRGLWPAVSDFLDSHPEWKLHRRYRNNHGFTILVRQS